jgi:protein-S-isoprenylcysteine O-methyltransferase Ste14
MRNLSYISRMARFFEDFQLAAIAVFLLVFAGRSLHLRAVRGVAPIRIARGKPLPDALLEGLLVIALPVWIYEVLAFAWPLPWHLVPEALGIAVLDSGLARALGALLVVSGLVLFALALAAFGDGWRVGIDTERPGELVTRGVFGISRNPIFVFMNAYALGTFLLSGRLVFLVFALLAAAALHAQIRREEVFLEEAYGEAYRAYRAATPRYLLW